MKICILGALGYVGFELCKQYKNSEHEIIAIDSNFLSDKVAWLTQNGIKFYHRDIFKTRDLIKDADVIYNLVSITLVPQTLSQSSPEKDDEIYRVGTEGNRYILENISRNCSLIFPSSHVVWEGLTKPIEVNEDCNPCPFLAYGKSKYQSEIDIINSGNPYVIARLASVYGFNETCRWKILPNLFSKMAADNQNLTVFGGNNIKPLCGINDVSRILKMFIKMKYNKNTYNIVNECLTVKQIADICKEINQIINIIETNDETPNNGYYVSNKKILDTGFKFKQNIKTEIDKMINIWRNK